MGLLLLMLFFSLLLTWSWAQFESQNRQVGLVELLSTAAIEWGAMVSILGAHFYRPGILWEVPRFEDKLSSQNLRPTQIPIILVPSLHVGPSVFCFLYLRLKSHYFQSLWPFQFKSFLKDSIFLEKQLKDFLLEVVTKTASPRCVIISFGTSYPIVSRVLANQTSKTKFDWIAISGASKMPDTLKFVSSSSLNSAYVDETKQIPDLSLYGDKDTVCYPKNIFLGKQKLEIPEVGHFGALLHSKCSHSILTELQSIRLKEQELKLSAEERSS